MMLSVLTQLLIVGFAGLLLWAAVNDARHMIIPNRLGAAIALTWLAHAAVMLAGGEPGREIVVAFGIGIGALALGIMLFTMRLIGGGDVKLFAAVALWAGPGLVVPFALSTLVFGGILALAYLAVRTIREIMTASIPGNAQLTVGVALMGALKSQVPFGLAIAAGGWFVAYRLLFGVPAS